MRVTIEIDSDLLEEAMNEVSRQRLVALSGKVPEVEIASRRRLPKDSEVTVRLPPALQAELEEALEESDREGGISGDEFFRSLRKHG